MYKERVKLMKTSRWICITYPLVICIICVFLWKGHTTYATQYACTLRIISCHQNYVLKHLVVCLNKQLIVSSEIIIKYLKPDVILTVFLVRSLNVLLYFIAIGDNSVQDRLNIIYASKGRQFCLKKSSPLVVIIY